MWLKLDTWDEEAFDQMYGNKDNHQRNSSCDGVWELKKQNPEEDNEAVTIQGCLIENSEGFPQLLTYDGPKDITRKMYEYNWETKNGKIIVHKGKFTSPYEEKGMKDKDIIEWEDPDGDQNKKIVWIKQKREPLTVAMNDPKTTPFNRTKRNQRK